MIHIRGRDSRLKISQTLSKKIIFLVPLSLSLHHLSIFLRALRNRYCIKFEMCANKRPLLRQTLFVIRNFWYERDKHDRSQKRRLFSLVKQSDSDKITLAAILRGKRRRRHVIS